MKIITLLIGLLIGTANAGELSFGFGSITQHFWYNKHMGHLYEGRINNNGLIFNYVNTISYTDEEYKRTVFFGDNSIRQPMLGFKMTKWVYKTSFVEVGPMIGTYWQDPYPFLEKGIMPLQILPGFSPIIGAEFNIKLFDLGTGGRIMLNNNITPFLSTHGIELGVEF
jgi:hypothetical protein